MQARCRGPGVRAPPGNALRCYPPHWWRSFTCSPKPPETHTGTCDSEPLWVLVFLWDLGKPEIRMSRMCLWGFGVWGALRGVLDCVAKLAVEVDGT